MVRLRRAIVARTDNKHSSFWNWIAQGRFFTLFLAMLLAASTATLSRTGSTAQEATPGARSESTAMSPVEAASTWLRQQQDASGGFLGFSGEPDPGATTDAVIALYAAQQGDPAASAL